MGQAMFIVSLTYKTEISEVERYIDLHVQFLDKYYAEKKFICSGRKNPRTGGIILVRGGSRAELLEIIQEDPFTQHGVAGYTMTEFLPTRYDEGFAGFSEPA